MMNKDNEEQSWMGWAVVVLLAIAAIVSNTIMPSLVGIIIFMVLLSGCGYLACRH